MNALVPSNSNRGHLSGTFGFLIAQVLALAAGLVVQSIAARSLSAMDYGRFAVAHTLLLVATHLLCGVLPRAFAQHLSVYPGDVSAVWRTLIKLHLPVSLFVALLIWGCRTELAGLFADTEMAGLTTIVAILVVVHCGILEPCWQILNGLRQHGLQAVLLAVHGVLRCAAISWAVWFRADGWWATAGMLIASSASATLVSTYCVLRLRSTAAGSGRNVLGIREVWQWARFSSLVDLAFYVGVAFNLWSVKALVADAGTVAVYAACFVLAQANLSVCRTVSRGFFSYVAAAHGTGDVANAVRLVRSAGRLLLIGLSLELAIVVVVGGVFVEWFSGRTVANDLLPAVLMLGSAGVGACCVLSDFLAAAKQLRSRFFAAAAYAPAAIGIGMLATFSYGVVGASVAYCLSGFVALCAMTFMCQRVFGTWDLFPTLVRCAVSGAAAATIARELLPEAGIARVMFGSLLVAALYFASLAFLGEFPAAERRLLTGFLSRRRRRRLLPAGEQLPEESNVSVS